MMNIDWWPVTVTLPLELRGEPIVIDDIGNIWHFKNERIVCWGDDSKEGGYHCIDIAHGIAILKESGYISEET